MKTKEKQFSIRYKFALASIGLPAAEGLPAGDNLARVPRQAGAAGSKDRRDNPVHYSPITHHRLTTNHFIFPALGCTLQAFTGYVMASRTNRSDVQQTKANSRDLYATKANSRATFKLFGQAPMQATIPSRNRAGFWIQGGKLAEYLGGCDYSGVDVDVCFLSANKVEWYKVAAANSHAGEPGK